MGHDRRGLQLSNGYDMHAGQCPLPCIKAFHSLAKKDDLMMTNPPSLPDLTPIENNWVLLKCEVFQNGKQCTNLSSIWEWDLAASINMKCDQIKNLTGSMDNRLMMVIEKKH